MGLIFLTIKKKDFVQVEYVGKVDGKIFDLTDEALAKKEGIYKEEMLYGPITVVVGAGHLIKGLDKSLEGKNVGDSYDIEIQPGDGFGSKNPKLLKIVPQSAFKDQKIKPQVGMQLNIDGIIGAIVSVSSGRIVIDFNHPLSGKILNYHMKVKKIITEKKEQVAKLFETYTNLDSEKVKVETTDKTVKIIYNSEKDLNEKAKEVITEDIKKYTGFETVEITKGQLKSKE